MPANRVIVSQEEFGLGMFPGHEPRRIPSGGSREITNGLLDDSGAIFRRGPTQFRANFGSGLTAPLTFLWAGRLPGAARILYATADGFGCVKSDNDSEDFAIVTTGRPFQVETAQLDDMLFIAGHIASAAPLAIYGGSEKPVPYGLGGTVSINFGSNIVTGSATDFATGVDPGMLFQANILTPGEHHAAYPVKSVDSATQVTLTRPWLGPNVVAESDYSFTPFLEATTDDPYFEDAEHVAVVANRLVFTGSPEADNEGIMVFTGVNNPQLLSLTDFHKLPNGARTVGLKGLQQSVINFSDLGVFKLDGLAFNIVDPQGNPQHRLAKVYDLEMFGSNASAVAEHLDSLVVPATEGIFLINGISAPERISRSIDPYYRSYVYQAAVDLGAVGGAVVYHDHYFLPIGDAHPDETLVCRLDRGVQTPEGLVFPWTRLSFDNAMRAFAVLPPEPAESGYRLLAASGHADKRVLDATDIFRTAPGVPGNLLFSTDAHGDEQPFVWLQALLPTGEETLNVVRFLRAAYTLDGPLGSETLQADVFGDSYAGLVAVGTLPEDPSGEGHPRLRIGGGRFRYVALRLTCSDATHLVLLRRVSFAIRPSQAIRK